MRKNTLLLICFYWAFLLCIAFLMPPIPAINSPLPFHATNLDIRQYWGGSDVGSYALGGWTMFSEGHWEPNKTLWLIALWPPGLMLLYASILKVFGIHAYALLILELVAALFLAVALNTFRRCLELFIKRNYAVLLPLCLLLFPQFRIYMLDRSAIVMGETFAISAALTGLFCLILAYARNKKTLALLGGLAFALSAYFRPTCETFFVMSTVVFVTIFLLTRIYKHFSNRPFIQNTTLTIKKINPLTVIFLALVAFHSSTVPYRFYIHHLFHSFAWVQDAPYVWMQNFTPSEVLKAHGGDFEDVGQGNIACKVDETLCKQLSIRMTNNSITPDELRHYVFLTLLRHPFKWLQLKYSIVPHYWFGAVNNYGDFIYPSPIRGYLENWIFTFCFIFSFTWSILKSRNPYAFICAWLNISVLLSYLGVFLFAHYENRYFFFFKFYFLATAIFGLVCLFSKQEKVIYDKQIFLQTASLNGN